MSHKTRYAANTDKNQTDIVKQLRQIPGVTVALNHDDFLIGCQNLTFWVECKSVNALKKDGTLRKGALKKSQKDLLQNWRGDYFVASTFEQIIEHMNETFRKFGLGVIRL